MAQNSVFSQIIKLIPRREFEKSVRKHHGDKKVRSFNCWSWFGSLLFSQLSGHDSIRSLERLFAIGNKEFRKLGFSDRIRKSTLADANHKRPVVILEEIFQNTLKLLEKHPHRKSSFKFQSPVFALDSSFIRLCLTLCPWSYFSSSDEKRKRPAFGGIKLHTAIDLAGEIPEFVHLKTGTGHVNVDHQVSLEHFHFKKGSVVVMDRGYWKTEYLSELTSQGVFFVTRQLKRLKFRVAKSRKVDRTRGHLCDQDIYLTGKKIKNSYAHGKLRRIVYRDPETNKDITFITNRFDLATQTIADLYKSRWRVELFFKCLKQNLKIKKFLGFSENAVKAQVWVALIAYMLLQYLRLTMRSCISMPDTKAVIGTLLLLKLPLKTLLGKLPDTKRHPPPLQLRLNF